jgi:hypothetical protein
LGHQSAFVLAPAVAFPGALLEYGHFFSVVIVLSNDDGHARIVPIGAGTRKYFFRIPAIAKTY